MADFTITLTTVGKPQSVFGLLYIYISAFMSSLVILTDEFSKFSQIIILVSVLL